MNSNKNKNIVPISKNFKDGAIIISFVIMLISFIVTATWFNSSIYIASFMSGVLIAILFLIIGLWKRRTWAIVAAMTFFYSFAVLAVSVFGNWPGFLDMAMAGATATVAMLITGIFVSVIIANSSWKKLPKINKYTISIAYVMPFVILIGGYFSGLAMNLRLERSGDFGDYISPTTSAEAIYGNIGGTVIGIGVAAFLIINLMLIYTILVSKKVKK